MSELKSFIVLYGGKFIRAYKESEADKVIAELKKKIEEQKRLRDMALASVPNALKVAKIIQHNKYKRCLAMANWCYAKWDDTATKYYKSVWYRKWEVKWLELAEKFKEE